MREILCFGDSNTYGYIPGHYEKAPARYPWGIRWTSRDARRGRDGEAGTARPLARDLHGCLPVTGSEDGIRACPLRHLRRVFPRTRSHLFSGPRSAADRRLQYDAEGGTRTLRRKGAVPFHGQTDVLLRRLHAPNGRRQNPPSPGVRSRRHDLAGDRRRRSSDLRQYGQPFPEKAAAKAGPGGKISPTDIRIE